MASFTSFVQGFLQRCNPDPTKAGNTLLYLNVFAMALAGIANTFAIAKDKNTSSDDKKFLVPAGLATGAANVGIYWFMTRSIIDQLEKNAQSSLDKMGKDEFLKSATEYTEKCWNKANKGFLGTNLFKKSDEVLSSMKQTLFVNSDPKAGITEAAQKIFKEDVKGGASVLGAFAGVIIGCGILTPIIRDVSAYFIQRRMERHNPELKEKPYRPYFDPGHWKVGQNMNIPKQPLNFENYRAFTGGKTTGGAMKV